MFDVDNNGSSAISFEVISTTPIKITDISNTFSTTGTTDIWIRVGGVNGAPRNTSGYLLVDAASGWVLHQTASFSGGTSTYGDGTVPIQGLQPISIPANTPVGIVLSGTMTYSNTVSPTDFTDGTVTLRAGGSATGPLYGFGGTVTSMSNFPRGFVGSITYVLDVVGGCSNYFTNFAVDSISGYAAKVNWTPGSGNSLS